MKILVVEKNKEPYIKDINGSLESMQKVVGGLIEAIYPFDDEVALICNEEGKINGLDLNRYLFVNNKLIDVIFGTFFLCSAPADSESFLSLSEEQVEKYIDIFKL